MFWIIVKVVLLVFAGMVLEATAQWVANLFAWAYRKLGGK